MRRPSVLPDRSATTYILRTKKPAHKAQRSIQYVCALKIPLFEVAVRQGIERPKCLISLCFHTKDGAKVQKICETAKEKTEKVKKEKKCLEVMEKVFIFATKNGK